MKLLIFGDVASGTGFGTVARGLGAALIVRDVDCRFVSINEEGGELEEPFTGRTALLGDRDGWLAGVSQEEGDALRARMASGELSPEDHGRLQGILAVSERLSGAFTGGLFMDGWTPDAALVIGDVASLDMSPILGMARPRGFPIFHYVPIEGVGLPPAWRQMWDPRGMGLQPIALCEFGAEQIAALGLQRPPVIYHGVDRDTFYPVSARRPLVMGMVGKELVVLRSKEDCRRFLGWPQNETIMFRADRNMPRKTYPAMFRAIAPVLAKHPNTRVVWHCRTIDQGGNLAWERSKYPEGIGSRMQSTGFHDSHWQGVPRKVLAAMYNAADLYLSTSAEGFGLTIAESLACGVPCVGLDYSSVPEVIGPAGVTVRARLTDNIYSHFWATPDEAAYAAAVDSLVTDAARRSVLGAKGPYHVERFTWARAAEQVEGLLSPVREEVAA